jgi:DNA-binding NarL/FixJ family response regulator
MQVRNRDSWQLNGESVGETNYASSARLMVNSSMGVKRASSSAQTRPAICVMIADRTRMDCQLLAVSLRDMSDQCQVVGTAISVSEARMVLKQFRAAVALISPHLADGRLAGFDLVQEMRASFPATRAVMLLDSMAPPMVVYSFQVGARGVFSRDRSVEALAKCIAVVHRGQIWASTEELQIILEAMAKRSRFDPVRATGIKVLTKREGEVASLVAEGLRNREISERMKLSAHTVKNYVYRVYEKLGISSRVELTAHVLARAEAELASESPLPDKRLAG